MPFFKGSVVRSTGCYHCLRDEMYRHTVCTQPGIFYLGRYMYWVFVQGWGVSHSVSFRFHESGQTQIRWLILSFGSETFLDPRLPRSQFIPEAACTPHTAKHAGQPDYDYTKKDHSLVYPWSMVHGP